MLKGTILKNVFKLSAARCTCPEVAEKLIRRWMPNAYRDGENMVAQVKGLGDIEFVITREEWPTRGVRAYRIVVSNIFPDDDTFPEQN